MDKEKINELKEKLLYRRKNAWNNENAKNEDIMKFSKEYMYFLKNSKTERDAVKEILNMLKENGFVDIAEKESLQKGDRIYYINNEKAIYVCKIGENTLDGLNIIGSHLDSPRLDLKPNPLFDKGDMLYLKTHYYGGIKKYQWTTIPLSLKGIIITNDGRKIDVNIGEEDDDPVFVISDLLVHLAKDQMFKRAQNVVEGERLNITFAGIPIGDTESAIKLNILKMLNEKYGILEKDFLTAEIQAVPAYSPRDLGLDRAYVLGYGQDDKVCSFASIRAILDSNDLKKTTICIFSDKEEIGSTGNTGMESELFDMFVQEILEKQGINGINALRKIYSKSNMLSADVDGAFDSNYPEAFEKTNNSIISDGVVLSKYTGSGGKYNASDASSEYISKIAKIFENNNIVYQITELGKIDQGGGGTIAYILANKGINVVDCGIALQSMHSPYEISSKADIYQMYLAYMAFLKEA